MSQTNRSDADLGIDARRGQAVSGLYPLRPGETIPGDWCGIAIPTNVEAAGGARIDSASVFTTFRGRRPAGLRIGRESTLCGPKLTVGPRGLVEVGERCYLAEAIVLCEDHIIFGDRVAVAGSAVIADSDYHPIDQALRALDCLALAAGATAARPPVEARPVVIAAGNPARAIRTVADRDRGSFEEAQGS